MHLGFIFSSWFVIFFEKSSPFNCLVQIYEDCLLQSFILSVAAYYFWNRLNIFHVMCAMLVIWLKILRKFNWKDSMWNTKLLKKTFLHFYFSKFILKNYFEGRQICLKQKEWALKLWMYCFWISSWLPVLWNGVYYFYSMCMTMILSTP
jgi:hypothetical protein